MTEYWNDDDFCIIKEKIMPVCVKCSGDVESEGELLARKPACISFKMDGVATFAKKGAYVVLDFGKELCGSLRFVTRETAGRPAMFRITLGESLTEACSSIGEKNATNDHSPRDFTAAISDMSDLTYGLSGFRFARIELLTEEPVAVRNIFAVNILPKFEKEGYITTSDDKFNRIIETAIYTLKFQILAGRRNEADVQFLEQGGAKGYSTFMAYYILTADAMANGKAMLPIIKEYFGAMLSRGATTFWEDFHMEWLEGSGRIDEFPKEGEKDIHGDYGDFCYKGFRHSLCHGWASGVLAFVYEYMLGLKLADGGDFYEVTPHPLGVKEIHAKIPTRAGWLVVDVVDGKANVNKM